MLIQRQRLAQCAEDAGGTQRWRCLQCGECFLRRPAIIEEQRGHAVGANDARLHVHVAHQRRMQRDELEHDQQEAGDGQRRTGTGHVGPHHGVAQPRPRGRDGLAHCTLLARRNSWELSCRRACRAATASMSKTTRSSCSANAIIGSGLPAACWPFGLSDTVSTGVAGSTRTPFEARASNTRTWQPATAPSLIFRISRRCPRTGFPVSFSKAACNGCWARKVVDERRLDLHFAGLHLRLRGAHACHARQHGAEHRAEPARAWSSCASDAAVRGVHRNV
ncbi:hypothetical protein COLO4_02064 [Corchorus olitorius]|uniref:C2H2-type domain-containing protein n=1 Tax=Corchorus olitorius TaxID=93759 RepID=A0A1R3L1I7_9ROSI|nr:hypothetical protein COLO4_02064 [Corchorus olitorius]